MRRTTTDTTDTTATDSPSTDPFAEQRPHTIRWPWWPWVVAGGIAMLVLVLVIGVALLAPTRDHAPNPAPSRVFTPPMSTSTSPDSRDGRGDGGGAPLPGFGLPATDLFGTRLETPPDPAGTPLPQDSSRRPDPAAADYLMAAPAGMMWQCGWGGAALPFSTSDGPTTVTDGIASGFARTPQGAALAAYDALARAIAAPDDTWEHVLEHRFTGSPGQHEQLRDRYARSRAETPDAARFVIVPRGFRIDEWSPQRADFAVVRIAVPDRDGTAASTWPMVWVDGDWHVRTPEAVADLWARPQPVQAGVSYGAWR